MKNIFLVVVLVMTFKVFAQEESFPCQEANTELKKLFKGETVDNLYVHACFGPGLHGLASSYLKASGTAPKIIEDPNGMEPPEDTEYVKWTCKYSMGNLQDGDIATAWVEGADGHGINEVLIVPCLDLKKNVEIFAGYGKSDNLHQFNNRPKKIRTIIIRAKMQGATQYGSVYKELKSIAESVHVLEDKNAYQFLPIPSYKTEKYFDESYNDHVEYRYFLGIEILEVYKGSKWEDTCISEIRNN
ncbi:MAG: hypothetical protein AAF620_11105 [Bacteroidota bacterium]